MMVQITQNTHGSGGALIWAVMESGCALVEKCGTEPKQNLTESSFFEISNKNFILKHNLCRFFALKFSAVLE